MTEPKKPDLSATQFADRVRERLQENAPAVTPVRPSNGRASLVIAVGQVAEKFGIAFVHVLVGLIFMGGGIWLVAWTVQHPPINKMLLYGGGGAAVFGALLMPTILPVVKQIIVVVQAFPVIGAMIGGRRSTDPQSPEPKP